MADQMQWAMGSDSTDFNAYIESDEGNAIVRLERLMRPGLTGITVPNDAQWQGMIDLIAAAPEMLAVLKEVDRHFDHPGDLTYEGLQGLRRAVSVVLAKAEPPRKVKNTVHVTVQVVVETDTGEASEPGNVAMAAVDAVRDGEGDIIHHEIVTERTRGIPGRY
jgi:hypothetical protein